MGLIEIVGVILFGWLVGAAVYFLMQFFFPGSH